jgi:hypothetical protein
MKKVNHRNDVARSRGISRRDFLKLATAGLLAGCRPTRRPSAPTNVPTSAPTHTPTPDPPATSAARPVVTVPRSEIIKIYPDVPSKVVHTHHTGVWEGETLASEIVRQMLDASVTKLTGLNDTRKAWAVLFDPDERIAIKVSTIRTSDYWTHVPLVMAVTECLQDVGVPPEQIVIFDRSNNELRAAGYTINQDEPGVRCYETTDYVAGWTLLDTDIRLSDILLNCDALINMPILKNHSHSGFTFAMKNHFGTFNKPASFHRPRTGQAIAELNALSPIRERTRLIIGDMLEVCPISRHGWFEAVKGDSILMSFDPVAHDAMGFQWLSQVMTTQEYDTVAAAAEELAIPWLATSAELDLGTNDLDNMELVEVNLG